MFDYFLSLNIRNGNRQMHLFIICESIVIVIFQTFALGRTKKTVNVYQSQYKDDSQSNRMEKTTTVECIPVACRMSSSRKTRLVTGVHFKFRSPVRVNTATQGDNENRIKCMYTLFLDARWFPSEGPSSEWWVVDANPKVSLQNFAHWYEYPTSRSNMQYFAPYCMVPMT